jgi:hypothetical protein
MLIQHKELIFISCGAHRINATKNHDICIIIFKLKIPIVNLIHFYFGQVNFNMANFYSDIFYQHGCAHID